MSFGAFPLRAKGGKARIEQMWPVGPEATLMHLVEGAVFSLNGHGTGVPKMGEDMTAVRETIWAVDRQLALSRLERDISPSRWGQDGRCVGPLE
jgi:hypothetical protein